MLTFTDYKNDRHRAVLSRGFGHLCIKDNRYYAATPLVQVPQQDQHTRDDIAGWNPLYLASVIALNILYIFVFSVWTLKLIPFLIAWAWVHQQ